MTFDLVWAFLDALGGLLYAFLDVLHWVAPDAAYAMERGFDEATWRMLEVEDEAAEALE